MTSEIEARVKQAKAAAEALAGVGNIMVETDNDPAILYALAAAFGTKAVALAGGGPVVREEFRATHAGTHVYGYIVREAGSVDALRKRLAQFGRRLDANAAQNAGVR